MKQYVTMLSTFLCLLGASAQHSYSFSAASETYSDLASGKRISFALFDSLSGFYRLDELKGETFTWYNTNFKIDTIKTFHIQPYANLRFDNDTNLAIVDGGFTYLDSIDNNSSITYRIDGNSGEKVIKTQWKNLKIRVGQSSNFVNIQIWVFQSTGVIEVHYGASSSNNQSGFLKTNGPQVGMFYSRDNFSRCFEKLWVTGAPGAIKLDSIANYTFNAMSGIPLEGTVFRFTPRFKIAGVQPVFETGPVFFPNPVSGNTLYLRKAGNFTVADLQDRALLVCVNGSELDISELKPGMYLLKDASGTCQRFLRE